MSKTKNKKKSSAVTGEDVTDDNLKLVTRKASISLKFKWTKQMQVTITKVNYRVKAIDQWSDALKGKPVSDNDGEQTIFIDDFDPGTEIEFDTELVAITNVDRAAIILSQDNPKVAFKIKPPGTDEFKKLKVLERWPETFKYKVNDQVIA